MPDSADDDGASSSPAASPGMFAEPEGFYPPSPPAAGPRQSFTTRGGDVVGLSVVGHSATEAHHVWNGARAAAGFFEADPAGTVRGRTVLELGAGAGLPSLVAAALGARRVVMTDFPDAGILRAMRSNIAECAIIPAAAREAGVIVARGFVWGFDVRPLLAELPPGPPGGGFDVLVLADLLFRHSEHGRLLDTVRDAMAPGPGSRAYVFFTSYRPWLRHRDMAFFELARRRGFAVDKVLEQRLERPLFEDDPGDPDVLRTCTGWVLRWPREGEEVVAAAEAEAAGA